MSRKLIDNIIAIVGCAAVVALLFLASYAKAHDRKHHQPNPILADAKNKVGGSCCDGSDYTIADGWERLPKPLAGGFQLHWTTKKPSAH